MKSDVNFKVLWVDDQNVDENNNLTDFYNGWQLKADNYNIELDPYDNWEDAENALREHFEDYSAIILDANCKIKKGDTEQEEFITAILPSLCSIFGEKRSVLPWYILSAGTMSNFGNIVNGAKYQHSKHQEDWGTMLYLKDDEESSENAPTKLFENIARVAKDMALNVVLYRHSDTFNFLGQDKLIDSRARSLMIRMLSALYFPEDNIKFQYTGNPIRKVLEYLFRAARKKGLLAEECFDSMDHIVLLDASRYMAGLNVIRSKYQIRYGKPGNEKEGAGGDCIFSSEIAMIVKNLINYSSSDSHTEEDEPYFIDEENKDYFFAYVLQMCHVIRWFGKFVEDHSDVEANKKKQQNVTESSFKTSSKRQEQVIKPIVESKTLSKVEIIGKSYLIEKDVNGVLKCGESCKLSEPLRDRTGVVTIMNVDNNEGDDKDLYPYIVTLVK